MDPISRGVYYGYMYALIYDNDNYASTYLTCTGTLPTLILVNNRYYYRYPQMWPTRTKRLKYRVPFMCISRAGMAQSGAEWLRQWYHLGGLRGGIHLIYTL